MRTINPIHGVDYIVDYYAILGIPPDAQQQQIQTAYRNAIKKVHTDRIDGLDETLVRIAKDKAQILNRAYEILGDEEKRASYNVKLASFEPRLVSKDGTPIVNLGRMRIDLDYLLSGKEEGKEDTIAQIKGMTGYDEETLQALKDASNPKLRSAYRDMLERKLIYLKLLEETEWQYAGVDNQPDTDMLFYPDDHITKRKAQIDESKDLIANTVEKRVLAITGGEAPLLLPGEVEIQNTSDMKEKILALASDTFAKRTPILERIAQERTAVLKELVTFTTWSYFPPNQSHHEKLLLIAQSNGIFMDQMAFHLEGTQLKDITSLYQHIDAKQKAQEISAADTNVVVVEINPEIDILLQLGYVMRKHFESE